MPDENVLVSGSPVAKPTTSRRGSVAAIVLTYNEEQRVRECLESLTWCDEIQRCEFIDLKMKCDNGICADRIERELLTRMKQVGFV